MHKWCEGCVCAINQVWSQMSFDWDAYIQTPNFDPIRNHKERKGEEKKDYKYEKNYIFYWWLEETDEKKLRWMNIFCQVWRLEIQAISNICNISQTIRCYSYRNTNIRILTNINTCKHKYVDVLIFTLHHFSPPQTSGYVACSPKLLLLFSLIFIIFSYT